MNELTNYDDIITASNNLKIISSELINISNHLRKLNDDMKTAIRGTAGEYFTNKIVPLGVKKSNELSKKSESLSNRLTLLTRAIAELGNNIEDTNIDFL